MTAEASAKSLSLHFFSLAIAVSIVGLAAVPAVAEVLNSKEILEHSLARYGKFTIVGKWNGSACELGIIPDKEPLVLLESSGVLPHGITIGGPETVLDVQTLAEDKKTFQNCNTENANPSANFSATITKSLTVSFSKTFSETLSGQLNLSAGAPRSGSAAIGIGRSKTWSTGETTSQTTSISVTMGNSYSTQLRPGTEIDISYIVLSKRTSLPISADGVFDGKIYPCQHGPSGATKASDLLSEDERTITASGTVQFDNAQEGTFQASTPRPLQCTKRGVFIINQ
jgi:hypothetical protein